MVERAHRQLKDALRSRCSAPDWPAHLPWVLLGLRSAPKEDSGIYLAELVYGTPLTVPAQLPLGEEVSPAAVNTAFPLELRHVETRLLS